MSQTRFLSEYRPWPFRLHETRLDVTLAPRGTRVQSDLRLERVSAGDLTLDGGAGLRTISVAIDGTPVPETALTLADETMTIAAAALPEGPFTLSATVEIDPEANTTLEGLYL